MNLHHIIITKGQGAEIEEYKSLVEEYCRKCLPKSHRRLKKEIHEKASSLIEEEGLTWEEALSRLEIIYYNNGKEPEVVRR